MVNSSYARTLISIELQFSRTTRDRVDTHSGLKVTFRSSPGERRPLISPGRAGNRRAQRGNWRIAVRTNGGCSSRAVGARRSARWSVSSLLDVQAMLSLLMLLAPRLHELAVSSAAYGELARMGLEGFMAPLKSGSAFRRCSEVADLPSFSFCFLDGTARFTRGSTANSCREPPARRRHETFLRVFVSLQSFGSQEAAGPGSADR
jgi:hypothetical protein